MRDADRIYLACFMCLVPLHGHCTLPIVTVPATIEEEMQT
jgi:hypothetical protein